jgi:hypothetical protein
LCRTGQLATTVGTLAANDEPRAVRKPGTVQEPSQVGDLGIVADLVVGVDVVFTVKVLLRWAFLPQTSKTISVCGALPRFRISLRTGRG